MKVQVLLRSFLAVGVVAFLGRTAGAQSWSLTGNAGTNPATNFLGTSDNQPLEIRVNGQRALRLAPSGGTTSGFSLNLIGGWNGNSVSQGTSGATICGGGSSIAANRVTNDFGTVGGGYGNQAGGSATVAGGDRNSATGTNSTVGGGISNEATGIYSTVAGGGDLNRASGDGSTVGGGGGNTASGLYSTVAGGGVNNATGRFSMVPGGGNNTAAGSQSLAAGTRAKASHHGAFVWGDNTNKDIGSTQDNQFVVRAHGGAFFLKGSMAPPETQAALQAIHGTGEGEAAWLQQVDQGNPWSVIKLLRHPGPDSLPPAQRSQYNFVEGHTGGSGIPERRRFHIDRRGTYHGGSDFAEALTAKGDRAGYEPGDVLVLSAEVSRVVEKAFRPYDVRVAGVYSTRPAVLGADKDGETRMDPEELPVAILGIVPTKVTAENGSIQPGDLLTTSSTPGHAMKATPVMMNGVALYPTGAILGKALGPMKTKRGIVEVLVTLR